MAKFNTQALPGFADLLPAEQIAFKRMLTAIERNFQLAGFLPLDLPLIERAEILLEKGGGDNEKQIYTLQKGDTDLALRYDHTVPLARYVSEHQGQLVFPFKRYAIGKVYRGEKPQAGRFREFYQCDIDVIGREKLSPNYDAEMPAIIANIFTELGLPEFKIHLNDRRLFSGLFNELAIPEDQRPRAMQIIDKLEKIGLSGVTDQLQELGIGGEKLTKISKFIGIEGEDSKGESTLHQLRELGIADVEFQQGLDSITTVNAALAAAGIEQKNYQVDTSIARGLDYYTGTVYETRLTEHPDIGSICSGGRYDNLAGKFSRTEFPGVGISIGLTRLFDQLAKRNLLALKSESLTKVLVIPMESTQAESFSIATELREAGINTEIYLEDTKLAKKFAYADKLQIPFCLVIGREEVESNAYTLKDMTTSDQEQLTSPELVAKLSP